MRGNGLTPARALVFEETKVTSDFGRTPAPAAWTRFQPPVISSIPHVWTEIIAERYRASPGETSVPQGPATHLVMLLLGSARGTVRAGSPPAAARAVHRGDAAFIPAGWGFAARWNFDADTLMLRLDPAFVRHLAETTGADTSRLAFRARSFDFDPEIRQHGLALLGELQTGGLHTRLYAESLTNALAIHLLRKYSSLGERQLEPPRELSRVQLKWALEYIHEHFTVNLSVAEIATAAGLSESAFTRLFKQATGHAPHEYLIRYRVEHAARSLAGGDRTISEIAIACGFADQSHLARHFRRILGVTPSQFRKESGNVR